MTSPFSAASTSLSFVTGSLVPLLPAQNARVSRRATCPPRMGRRSEKIKGRKDAQTQARTKVFARIGKTITMAAKTGGSDVISNKALADAIEAAKAVNFPKDTMEKAIARATNADQADFKASSFEAYGFGGAAIFIDVLTDNANRAAAAIRTAINKSKMKIASPGSVAFNFDRVGVVRITTESVSDADELLIAAIESGADECDLDMNDDSFYCIRTQPALLNSTRKSLEGAGYDVEIAQLEMFPKTWTDVSERDMDRNMHGIDMLNALEDVDGVYMNAKLQ